MKAWIGIAAMVVLAGCGPEGTDGGSDVLQATQALCAPDQESLSGFNWFRFRKESPGTVTVSNTKDELVVDVKAMGEWKVSHWHLYAGTGEVPENRWGFEAPGRFPYQGYGEKKPTEQIRIPLTDLGVKCDDALTMSLHVFFVQVDAAGKVKSFMRSWANWHVDLNARRLGGEFVYGVCCEEDPPPPPAVNCVKAPWYYAQTPDAWNVEQVRLGSSMYTKAEAMNLLSLDWYEEADVSIALANAMIGVRLNQADGLVLPAEAAAVAAQADALIDANKDADGRLPYGISVDSPAGLKMYDAVLYLFDFNVGNKGVPFCGG